MGKCSFLSRQFSGRVCGGSVGGLFGLLEFATVVLKIPVATFIPVAVYMVEIFIAGVGFNVIKQDTHSAEELGVKLVEYIG